MKNQPDIIRVITYPKKIKSKSITISLTYEVILPDAKFTGYGYNAKGDALLRYWYIALSPIYENQWKNYSHLNLDDYSIQAASYDLRLITPQGTSAQSNLVNNKSEDGVHYFSGQHNRK